MRVLFSKPSITEEMTNVAVECLKNDRLVNGKSVKEFEENFARYVGTKYAIAVSSGTAALYLSLLGLGIKKGDIVITQSATFVATANAIVQAGATPLFIDINRDNLDFNEDQFKSAMKEYGNRVKAVIPVHLYGRIQDLSVISELLSEKNIPIIEDACQAHGAEINGKKAGSLGRAGAFSFYSSKNITLNCIYSIN